MIETSVTKELMWELSFQEMAKYFLVHDEFLESITNANIIEKTLKRVDKYYCCILSYNVLSTPSFTDFGFLLSKNMKIVECLRLQKH